MRDANTFDMPDVVLKILFKAENHAGAAIPAVINCPFINLNRKNMGKLH